ncbi:putative COF1-cofilin [Leucogyrophana mollusca]|uniref:COF1-cofilin n=1 Tax=Leucogyrophana mollusca TaxID=85980 RepID=A0ACB8BT45_9AGAM|nr:putative COF1-cofilin [Leucogyrophana mollusca]
MASGVAVNQQCLDEFQKLKLGKEYKYVVFTLNTSNTEVIVEKASTSTDYDEFLKDLPETGCRWAVYDFEFDLGEGKRKKICFFSWSPDDAKIKQKMLYASSKDALRKPLVGIALDIQGTDYSEVSYESVLEKASRNTR